MPSTKTRRLSAQELASDEAVIIALKNLATYKPIAGMPTVDELISLSAVIETKQEVALQTENTAVTARDALITAQWARREAVLRAKALVIAQYGRDSDEVKLIGLKRQIDRRRPARRAAGKSHV